MKRSLFLAVLATLFLICPSARSEEGSLDDMWQEHQSQKTDQSTGTEDQTKNKSAGDSDISAPVSSNSILGKKNSSSTGARESGESAGSEVAPLCSLTSLHQSEFIRTGGWPGVGPFKADTEKKNEMIDDANNRMKYSLKGTDVTRAELMIVNQKTASDDLLPLEMTADFFLEALGLQDRKIADFNSAFESRKESIGKDAQGVSLNAGTYEVSIKKAAEDDKQGFLISVMNTRKIEPADSGNNRLASAAGISGGAAGSAPGQEKQKSSVLDKPVSDLLKSNTFLSSTGRPASTATSTTAPQKPKEDLLQRQFTSLVRRWQEVKRATVKNRQSQNLNRILGGRALANHGRAIKSLLDKHKYYEMIPRSLKVDKYSELEPGRKYEVEASIKERRKFIDADKMEVLKDSEESYVVMYTVEKVRGTWLITDSRVVKSTPRSK